MPPVLMRSTSTSEQQVTREFNRFLADIDQLLNSARQLTGDSATLVRRRLEDKVAQARVRLEAARGVAAEQFDIYPRPSQGWWMNRSVQIAGVGVLVGALVATAIIARRSQR